MSRSHKFLMPKSWGGGFQKGNVPWNKAGSVTRNAYYAGLVDGEGHIGIYGNSPYETHRYNKVSVRISMSTKTAIEEGQRFWGGWISERKNRKSWEWSIQSFYAVKFLKDILPHLREKKDQAEIVIEFYRLQKRRVRQVIQKIPTEELEYRNSLIKKLKSLHLDKGTHISS